MARIISPEIRTSALQVTESVRSLFVLELLAPGPYLYLCASHLSNTPILLNRLGQFGQLFPEIERQLVRLDDLLALLSTRGVEVRLIHQTVEIEELLPAIAGSDIHRYSQRRLFPQGLFSTKLGIAGQLYFGDDTVDGGSLQVDLLTDALELEHIVLQLDSFWGELR